MEGGGREEEERQEVGGGGRVNRGNASLSFLPNSNSESSRTFCKQK